MAAGPGFTGGARVTTAVDLHDARATMLEATGTAQPSGWTGTPLQSLPRDDRDRIVFAEYHGHGTRGSFYMVRRGKWKLIVHVDAPQRTRGFASSPISRQIRRNWRT